MSYPLEVGAVRALRAAFPQVGPYKLARMIDRASGFPRSLTTEEQGYLSRACVRSFYSILSVIRRYDVAQRKARAVA